MVETDEHRSWVLASQNGDHAAFEALVKTHQQMIHALAFRMTGSMADAEDLAQETFIQAHRQMGRFRGDSAFSSWLYRIAVNQCLNWRQRDLRRRKLHEGMEPMESHSTGADDATLKRVQAALMKLHPKQRAAVVLTVYDGHSHAEAARLLGVSETTVSWRLFAARGKLKRWLSANTTGVRDE